MPEVEITFDDKAWRDFLREIKQRSTRADDFLRAAFATHGFADIQDHFRNEEGPNGPWASWSDKYRAYRMRLASGAIKRRARAGKPPVAEKILQLTGTLRQSLLPGDGKIKGLGRTAIKVFSNVRYSGKHDEGERGLPARPFMWLSDAAMDKIAVTVLDFYLGERTGRL